MLFGCGVRILSASPGECGSGRVREEGMGEIYCERNIVKCDVELRCPPGKILSHQSCNVLSLSDQLACIELSNHALEDFVDNRGQNSLIIIRAERSVYCRKGIDTRA